MVPAVVSDGGVGGLKVSGGTRLVSAPTAFKWVAMCKWPSLRIIGYTFAEIYMSSIVFFMGVITQIF